jgi:hypothetical protein
MHCSIMLCIVRLNVVAPVGLVHLRNPILAAVVVGETSHGLAAVMTLDTKT